MRILLVHPGASWSTADVYDGVLYGLRHHGATVIPYRLDTRIQASHKSLHALWRVRKRNEPDLPKPNRIDMIYDAGCHAVTAALREQVDVVLVVSAMFLHPDVILMMKRAGLRVVVLFTESPYDHAEEMMIAKMVDGCWTNERAALPAFRSVNPNSGYLPHAWHPLKHLSALSDEDLEATAHDVVFVGSGFPERVAFFNAIDWSGIDLGLYGTWKGLGLSRKVAACVKGDQVENVYASALYRRSKIGISLYRTRGSKRLPLPLVPESLSPRAYELARCGVFHLSEYRSEVVDVFGDLVPTFATPSEASALIRIWLSNDDRRHEVAAALPKAVERSSWVERAQTVLGDLHQVLTSRAA